MDKLFKNGFFPRLKKRPAPARTAFACWRGGWLLPAFLALYCLLNFAGTLRAQNPPAHALIIEGIEIVGNHKTDKNVIFRYLTMAPGDPVTPELIAVNNRRLTQTNFFKTVEFYTRPGSEKGKVVVVIEVKERKGPFFQFEGGHSDLDGWYFVPASLRFDNAFGGGNRMGIKFTIGDRLNYLAFWYHNGNLFHQNAFVDLHLSGGTLEFIHYFGNERFRQDVDLGEFQVKFGGKKGLFRHLFGAFRSQTFDPNDFAIGDSAGRIDRLPGNIAAVLPQMQYQSFIVGITGDYRDNPVYPLNGFWGAFTVEATKNIDNDQKFAKVVADFRFFKRTYGHNVLAFHFKGGYTPRQAPFYHRFYLGGANSLRGYADRRLTPQGWGTKLLLTNAEYRFPLSKKNFPNYKTSAAVFFDAGGIWLPGQTPKLSDFYSSIGFGIRVRLPVVGTTRFDLAFPLKQIDHENARLHISLGHSF